MAKTLRRDLAKRYGDAALPVAPTDDEFLLPDEVALLLRVKSDTLYRWRLDGDGPPFFRAGPGSRTGIRYRKSDIDQYIRAAMRRSTAQTEAAA